MMMSFELCFERDRLGLTTSEKAESESRARYLWLQMGWRHDRYQ